LKLSRKFKSNVEIRGVMADSTCWLYYHRGWETFEKFAATGKVLHNERTADNIN